MKSCVIVGSGIAGLLSALMAAGRYEQVWLVEKARAFGGLLGSFERQGAIYDFGTHVPARTGNEAIDRLVYGDTATAARNFHLLPYLRSENYYGGRWNPSSPLLDTRTLAPADYARGVVELLQAPGAPAGDTNLHRVLLATFGETITEKVYRPVIAKLLGAELESLHREVLRMFGLLRVIALTPEATRALKAVPQYGNSLGFHSYTDGTPGFPYYYPKGNNGIGWWVEEILGRLKSAGVRFLNEDEVRGIEDRDGRITGVKLASGRQLPCSRLVWTIPPALAMRAAGMELRGKPPSFRTHTLCHFQFRDPLLKTFPQYLLCWAPEVLSYRITLYPNITPDRLASGLSNLTVEVLGDSSAGKRTAEIERQVLDELVAMGVVAAGNPVIDRYSEFLGNSFPVFTESLPDAARMQVEQLNSRFRNLTLFGRASGPVFVIPDILAQVYDGMRTLDD